MDPVLKNGAALGPLPKNYSKPSVASVIKTIRTEEDYVRARAGHWQYRQTPLESIESDFNWSIAEEVERRLTTSNGKIVVLDTGSELNPVALNTLAERFAEPMRVQKLELHGLHLSQGPEATILENGICIHNHTPRSFRNKNISPDIMFDAYGSIFHASEFGAEMFTIYLRSLAKCLAPNGIFKYSIDEYTIGRNGFAENSPFYHGTIISPTGHSFMWCSVDGGSEFFHVNKVFVMSKP